MSKTKKANFTLKIDEHILNAIRLNTPAGKPTLEDELYTVTDRVYKRYVSKDVRDFIALLSNQQQPSKATEPMKGNSCPDNDIADDEA